MWNNVFDHLWQSTLFAAAAALLSLALKKNHAQARHALWLAASLKFLLPFSLLFSLGTHLGFRSATQVRHYALSMVTREVVTSIPRAHVVLNPAPADYLTRSTIMAILIAVWLCGVVALAVYWWIRWRRVRSAIAGAASLREGREFEALARLQNTAGTARPVEIRALTGAIEPGVVGIFRPVLLIPAGIASHLSDVELESILAHELCHVRRRDNLAAAAHMIVEAIFWFHPLVWWIGARLVDERERACDEEVLRLGNPPEVYAESILKVCRYYLESPLVCVAGVTGADLKRRIETILSPGIATSLDLGRKLLLTAAAFASIAGPVALGFLSPVPGRASKMSTVIMKFHVTSLRLSKSNMPGGLLRITPDGAFTTNNINLKTLLTAAYDIREHQVSGIQPWMNTQRYDITAEADASGSDVQFRAMLRALLAEKFKLAVHRETREQPVYALRLEARKPQLRADQDGRGPMVQRRPGELNCQKISMPMLANVLAGMLGRSVLDQTGLKGDFALTLRWPAGEAHPDDPDEIRMANQMQAVPSIVTALQEQLGLRLEPHTAPVETVVVDHAEKITEK